MSLSREVDEAALEFARIALLASEPVMRLYADGPKARLKADRSPVTAADEEAQEGGRRRPPVAASVQVVYGEAETHAEAGEPAGATGPGVSGRC